MNRLRTLAGLTVLACIPILATSLAAEDATSHLSVSVVVVPSCTINTYPESDNPVSVSCTRGAAPAVTLEGPSPADSPAPAATSSDDLLIATINF